MYLVIQTLVHTENQALRMPGRVLSRIIAGKFFVVAGGNRFVLFTIDDSGLPCRLDDVAEFASAKAAYREAQHLAQ